MKNVFIFLPRMTQISTKCLVRFGVISGLFFLFSCEKKELPVKPYERGDALVSQVEMASDYKYQVWFSLNENKIVSSNARTDWDLAFEASATGFHIMLNGSNAMKVYKTNVSELSQVHDTLGFGSNSKADMPSGNLDSTAFGNWRTNNKVYIVNCGSDENGAQLGFYKIKILSQSATEYSFQYATLNSSEIKNASVTKSDDYNFIAYSLATNSQLIIEPKKMEYDLCFTQYTYLFYKPLQYYQVTGVLTNNYNTRVATSEKLFNDITVNDTSSVTFLTRRDVIGYNWKDLKDDGSFTYVVNSKKCYIIQDSKGFYYKLHFVDFYSEAGVKGSPKFEFKKL